MHTYCYPAAVLTFYAQMTFAIAVNGTQMNVANNSFERYRNVNVVIKTNNACVTLANIFHVEALKTFFDHMIHLYIQS